MRQGVVERALAAFPVKVCQPDEVILENVRSALSRNLPAPSRCLPHGRTMAVAGGGPSLDDTWRDLDGVICAVNATLGYLLERDVTPWAVGVMDPRPHMADMIERRDGVHYFIASTCHPSVFDKVEGLSVCCWHPLGMPGMLEAIGDRVGIGGGTTMGLRWLTLGHWMGFRRFDLHGFDSSFRGERTHAYADWTDGERGVTVFAGRPTRINFLQQIADFREMMGMFDALPPEDQVTVRLFGDGLLQDMAKGQGA